jgi:adenylate cyclase
MAYLEIVEGDSRGKTVRLGDETVIGRNAENTLCVPDSGVSRQHAVIRRKDTYFVIVDLGSANGTFINKLGLHRHVPQPLYEGDEVLLGPMRMLFRSEGQDPLAIKKKDVFGAVTISDASKRSRQSGLSMILTSETRVPSVSATMDASLSSFGLRGGEKSTQKELLDALLRMQAMLKVSQDLGALEKPDALLEKIMSSIFDMFPNADRAFIMLRDKATRGLVPALGRTRDLSKTQEEFPVSRTIINTVVDKKQSILSSDAQKDGRFVSQQSIVNLSIRSLMCAPFVCKDELLGVISVDTMLSSKAFNTDDLAMLTSIAGQAAVAIKNAELYTAVEKETQVRTQLSRYLSPDVVEGVIDGTIPLTLGGERKRGTVLFCDIVGFTAMAENLGAIEVVELLNRYFRITTGIITKNRGTLHKFGGDMIMAFWNVMFQDKNAQENALRASVEMQAAVWKFGCELLAAGQQQIYVGIGCNTGEFAGGNIGGKDRMEYTIIGDNVNLAQRIESLASRWEVFAAQQTYDPASPYCAAIKLPPAIVKGKAMPIHVYSIRGVLGENGDMLLVIPVIIKTSADDPPISGLLTSFRKDPQELWLCLPSTASVALNTVTMVEFDLPEFKGTIGLSAKVKSIEGAQTETPHCAMVVLKDIDGAEALKFFAPGTLVDSGKTWAEMARH